MENNFEQYKSMLTAASETANACLDMEGGTFFLAWAGELIQDLTAKGYCRSACLTGQKLCDAVGVDWPWAGCDEMGPAEKQAWLNLFAENLMGHVTVVSK